MTRQDKTRQDKTRQDKTRQDNVAHDTSSCQVPAQIKVVGSLDSSHESFESANRVYDTEELSPTIKARDYKDPSKILVPMAVAKVATVKVIGQLNETFESQGRVYDKNGLSPTLRCFQGGGLQPKIIDEKQDCKVIGGLGEKKSNGGTQYFQQDRVYHGDIQPAQPAQLTGGSYNFLLEEAKKYRIRKFTPRECWRLMGYTDEDFDKAAFKKDIFYLEGDKDKCNAKLKVVREKQKLINSETYVSCTINDSASMETLKTIKKLLAEMHENEKTQNVDFVITKSVEQERSECAINTTKCITFMGMRCILTEEKDQRTMVITVQDEEGRQNIGKSMKITTESNLNALKLYIILILTAQIMKSGIYGSSTLSASIRGVTTITECCENSILLKVSGLKMESMSTRVSQSQLYKQAGNAIVKQVLMAIFSQLFIQNITAWNERKAT